MTETKSTDALLDDITGVSNKLREMAVERLGKMKAKNIDRISFAIGYEEGWCRAMDDAIERIAEVEQAVR